MFQTWSCFLWSKHQSTRTLLNSTLPLRIKLIQSVYHVHKTDGPHLNPHPNKLHACLSLLLGWEGSCKGVILQEAAEINPVLWSEEGGKPSTFNGYQLVTLSLCIMRTFRKLVRHLMMDSHMRGFCFHILYVLHMTHSHLQRLRGTVRSLFLDMSTHTIESFLLEGEAQSDACGGMDAMFPWIINHLPDALQFMGLQSGVLDTLQRCSTDTYRPFLFTMNSDLTVGHS